MIQPRRHASWLLLPLLLGCAWLLAASASAAPLAQSASPVPDESGQIENILVLGMDQRPGDPSWRTDTIMVVSVDYANSRVGIVSVPRDLWVNLPGYGNGRINQADYLGETRKYPGGGTALAAKVIKDNLGLEADHWVRIRQEGLIELVNALGGVTVTLDCPLHEITPHPTIAGSYTRFDLPAGRVFLDGPTAKKFATYRYASNDLSRARRQQQLIWAIRDRALELNAIPQIPQLWRALSRTFMTDLSLLDVIRLARLGSRLDASQVRGLVFDKTIIQDATIGGARVLVVHDQVALRKALDGLFTAKPIAEQGREGSGRCAPTEVPPSKP
jgi:LCP family protein required for cell wall assembly